MNKKFYIRIFCIIVLINFLSIKSFSQYWIYRDESKLRNSINIGVSGIHTTSLYANYSHLIAPKHEIAIGIPVIRSSRQPEIGFFTNYRFHFNENLNTFFIGAFLNYSKIDGVVNETQTINGSLVSSKDYSNVTRVISFGPNLGKKWIMKSGFCYTAKVGYGICSLKSEWDEDFIDQEFKDFSDKINKIIGGIDLELTVGFAFNLKK